MRRYHKGGGRRGGRGERERGGWQTDAGEESAARSVILLIFESCQRPQGDESPSGRVTNSDNSRERGGSGCYDILLGVLVTDLNWEINSTAMMRRKTTIFCGL